MGKIGQLVVNDGMWAGEQIVTKNWIEEMTSAKVPPNEVDNTNMSWGDMWWKDAPRNVSFMAGHGGQFVLVNKDKNLVIVITSERHTGGDQGLAFSMALSIFDKINNIAH
jgi:CubicO group peptidase (beta-lactamase class C family)